MNTKKLIKKDDIGSKLIIHSFETEYMPDFDSIQILD